MFAVVAPVAVLWLLPLCSDLLSLLFRSVGQQRSISPVSASSQRLLFVIPAHNESTLIATTVSSLLGMHGSSANRRIVVIADNCTDDTAARARQASAEVYERFDPSTQGKPAALAWLIDRISLPDFDAVVVVDADTVVDPDFANALCVYAPMRGEVVQAHFGTANPQVTWLTRLASLFEDVRYLGQFPLKVRAGLNVVLTGNGMCLGTDVVARHGWVADSLTEDLELYARYTLAGVRIRFAPAARLFAQEARDLVEASVQRKRWQAGRLAVLWRNVLPAIRSGAIGFRQKLDLLAELAFPGPVAHAMIAACGSLLLLGSNTPLRWFGGLFVLSVAPTTAWTIAALARRRDRRQLLGDLVRLPIYGVWRGALAVRALLQAQRLRWERSPRNTNG